LSSSSSNRSIDSKLSNKQENTDIKINNNEIDNNIVVDSDIDASNNLQIIIEKPIIHLEVKVVDELDDIGNINTVNKLVEIQG